MEKADRPVAPLVTLPSPHSRRLRNSRCRFFFSLSLSFLSISFFCTPILPRAIATSITSSSPPPSGILPLLCEPASRFAFSRAELESNNFVVCIPRRFSGQYRSPPRYALAVLFLPDENGMTRYSFTTVGGERGRTKQTPPMRPANIGYFTLQLRQIRADVNTLCGRVKIEYRVRYLFFLFFLSLYIFPFLFLSLSLPLSCLAFFPLMALCPPSWRANCGCYLRA